jgi:hypothetical protein
MCEQGSELRHDILVETNQKATGEDEYELLPILTKTLAVCSTKFDSVFPDISLVPFAVCRVFIFS